MTTTAAPRKAYVHACNPQTHGGRPAGASNELALMHNGHSRAVRFTPAHVLASVAHLAHVDIIHHEDFTWSFRH